MIGDKPPGRRRSLLQGEARAAELQGYADRKVAETQATASAAVAGISATEHVLVELISVAKMNPLFGMVLAVIVADVLQRAKILSTPAHDLILKFVGVAFGVEVSLEVAQTGASILKSFIPWGGNIQTYNPADLVRPSPTTYVEGPRSPEPVGTEAKNNSKVNLGSLLAMIPKGVPPPV